MDKQKSITRSKQLHQIGQDLIHRLEQVPCGLQHSQIEMQHQRKKAILSYLNASEEDWNNWQWQITHRIQTIEALTALLSLTSEQVNEIKTVSEHFRFAISPYYFSLIDWRSPENDPIAKMSLPDIRELEKKGVSDPSAEEYTNPAGRIVRRYPNRVIINITNCCASFCRHCQRKRIIGSQDHMLKNLQDNRFTLSTVLEKYNDIYVIIDNLPKGIDQTPYWYSIYERNRSNPIVFGSNRDYLLLRDMMSCKKTLKMQPLEFMK